jgi:hypothetical protein
MNRTIRMVAIVSGVCLLLGTAAGAAQEPLGLFEGRQDIGSVGKTGSVQYDPDLKSYLVAGGGENMWFTNDAFHFVWKRVSGDVTLAADIAWIAPGGNPHRKACLLLRQSLGRDSPYADAAVHGDGLTSLQYREERGGPTREIQSNLLQLRAERDDANLADERRRQRSTTTHRG